MSVSRRSTVMPAAKKGLVHPSEEACGSLTALVRQGLHVGISAVVVNRDADAVVAMFLWRAVASAILPEARSEAYPATLWEASQLLHVEMDELAGTLPFVADPLAWCGPDAPARRALRAAARRTPLTSPSQVPKRCGAGRSQALGVSGKFLPQTPSPSARGERCGRLERT